MTFIQALILSILQGASELFPVSSLGHAVVVPKLLGWQNSDQILNPEGSFLPFLVTLHLGTALALFIFYWSDWRRIIGAFFGQFVNKEGASSDAKIANLLLIGTIPTGVLALVLEKWLRKLFANPGDAAIFLIVNGFLMIAGELLRQRAEKKSKAGSGDHIPLANLSYGSAFAVGLSQSLALIPGISRSGATITGGLLAKLDHNDSARFSFLLATPIILLAGIHEVPKLRKNHNFDHDTLTLSLIGFIVSGVVAYISVKFLTKYFETSRLDPFGYYCIGLGIVVLTVLGIHH